MIPGNILGKASRKSWCYYCTFKEFGKHISDENAWLCIAIEKSSFVASLCAGPGQIAGVILKSIFCDALIDSMWRAFAEAFLRVDDFVF